MQYLTAALGRSDVQRPRAITPLDPRDAAVEAAAGGPWPDLSFDDPDWLVAPICNEERFGDSEFWELGPAVPDDAELRPPGGVFNPNLSDPEILSRMTEAPDPALIPPDEIEADLDDENGWHSFSLKG